jgi:hypothetical protein
MTQRRRTIPTLVLLATFFFAAGVLCAQQTEPAETPRRDTSPMPLEDVIEEHRAAQAQKQAESDAPPAANIEEELTFAEIRRRMMQEQPVPITPARPRRQRSTRPDKPRWEDGQGIVSRLVVVDRDSMGWLSATFLRAKRDGEGNLPSVRLLQCPLLASIEEVMETRPEALFLIHGEISIFRSEPYLMLRRAAIWEGERPSSAGRVQPPEVQPAPAATVTPGGADPETKLSEAIDRADADVPDADTQATTDDVVAALMADQPGRALQAPVDEETEPNEAAQSVAPVNPKPLPAGERDLIADRTVRIIESNDGRWWEIRFIGDNTLREPPMRVLPGSLLAKSIALMNQIGGANRRFRITGEVLRYKGRRYLLLRKLLPERDMGQF